MQLNFWYQPSLSPLSIVLLPFSWIFAGLVKLRRLLYRRGWLKTVHFNVPVIIVGNITVGGTGKTPFVLWLAQFLKAHGLRPGIVSRGVGGQMQRLPYWVSKTSSPQRVGDEAVLLAERSGCPVVVGVDRVAVVAELLNKTDCNIVIADDGLQHYRLGRKLEIALVDSKRQFGNGCLIPAGPLREPKARLNQVDFIVYHGPMMTLAGDRVHSVQNERVSLPLNHFKNQTVHAVAGIGHPARFFSLLREQGLQIIEHTFPDHYLYCAKDLQFNDALPIIMTEKDAVKCKAFSEAPFWYLPVHAQIEVDFQKQLFACIKNL